MTITEEQRAGYVAKVEGSELRPEVKEHILGLLAAPDLSADTFAEIQDLIQEDIEVDFASIPGLADSVAKDPEYQALVEQTEREIAQIEQDLKDVEVFVTEEGAKLDAAASELEAGMDELHKETVRANLGL